MNWREPYRSIDMGGDPTTAGHVAWEWINDLGEKAKARMPDPAALSIEAPTLQGDGGAIALFHSTKLLAVATVFRDRLNFSILVRWMDEEFERFVVADPPSVTLADLHRAREEVRRCRSAMGSSTFHGRSKTEAAIAEVTRILAALGSDA